MERIYVGDFRLGDEEKAAINEVLNLGRLSESEKVREFERQWAKYIGTKYSILTSSGTTALMAGLSALKHYKNIKDGSKVITTPLTYVATSNAIMLSNLKPVYVDVDMENFSIIPEKLEELLEKGSEEYSIILPVHLMGYVGNMDKINKIAKRYNLITFEDSSQAHGSLYDEKKAGSLSLLSSFSFYIAHNIQAGEMGAINSDDKEIIRLIRKIKANGRSCDCELCTRPKGYCPQISKYKGKDDFDPRFTHDMIGSNYKVMEFQAALGLTQLKKADLITKKRQENVKYLNDGLEKHSNILQLPKYSGNVSYLAYPIVIKSDKISRKDLRAALEKKGIETRPLFGCIPTQQPAYSAFKKEYEGKLPNAEYLGKNAFYIGCHQYLEQKDLDYIMKTFDEILK